MPSHRQRSASWPAIISDTRVRACGANSERISSRISAAAHSVGSVTTSFVSRIHAAMTWPNLSSMRSGKRLLRQEAPQSFPICRLKRGVKRCSPVLVRSFTSCAAKMMKMPMSTQRPLSLGSTPLSSGKRSCSAMRRKRNGLRPYAKSTV